MYEKDVFILFSFCCNFVLQKEATILRWLTIVLLLTSGGYFQYSQQSGHHRFNYKSIRAIIFTFQLFSSWENKVECVVKGLDRNMSLCNLTRPVVTLQFKIYPTSFAWNCARQFFLTKEITWLYKTCLYLQLAHTKSHVVIKPVRSTKSSVRDFIIGVL